MEEIDLTNACQLIDKITNTIKNKNKYLINYFNKLVEMLKKHYDLQITDEIFIQEYKYRCLNTDLSEIRLLVELGRLNCMKNKFLSWEKLFQINENPSQDLIEIIRKKFNKNLENLTITQKYVKNSIFLHEKHEFEQKIYLIKQVSV